MSRIRILFLAIFLVASGEGNGDTGRRRVLFDPAHFGVLRTIYPEVGWIHSIDVSSNGRYLVTGGQNGSVAVIRTKGWGTSWKGIYPLGKVTSVAFSPRSETFAVAGSSSNRIYLLNAKEKSAPRVFRGEENPVYDLAWFPDGKRLVSTGNSGVVRIWNTEAGVIEIVFRRHRGVVSSMALSPDGSRFLTAGSDGFIRIYNSSSWKEIQIIRNPGFAIRHLQLARDGKTLYGVAQGRASQLRVWDVGSGKLLESRAIEVGKTVSGVKLGPAGRYLFVALGGDLQIWNRASLKLVETCKYHRGTIQAMGDCVRSGRVFTGGSGSQVTIWGRVHGGMSSVPARGFFGVQVQDAGNDLGARVVAVIPDTAAALSGVRMNDIITRVGLFKVRDTATTIAAIGIHSAGAKVSFTILREQETVTVTATLGKRPEGMDP